MNMDFSSEIEGYNNKLKSVIDVIDKKQIDYFIKVLLKHYETDNYIFIFGNGGRGGLGSDLEYRIHLIQV